MAIILHEPISDKRCFACGIEFKANNEVIVWSSYRDNVYMHPDCAKSIGQQLIRDVSQLIDLGYYDENTEYT